MNLTKYKGKPRKVSVQEFQNKNNMLERVKPDSNPVDDLNELFAGDIGGESTVVKELFSIADVKGKTELSKNEISIVSRLYTMSEVIEEPKLKHLLNELLVLRISMNRKSRLEFVESFKNNDQINKQAGLFQKFGGMFK